MTDEQRAQMLDAAQKAVMHYPYFTKREALEIAKSVVIAAQSASPEMQRIVPYVDCLDCRCSPE